MDQPRLILEYTKELARWDLILSRAEQNLDLVESEVGLQIREENTKEKITEAKIKSLVLQDQSYQNALEEYNRAKYNRDVVKGGVRGIEHKKTSMENMVRLYESNYFALPQAKRGGGAEKAQEEALSTSRLRKLKPRNKKEE